MTKLSVKQRSTLLSSITHRTTRFPRAVLHKKLESADRAYHLANTRTKGGETDPNNQIDSYSRFQELDDALVREVAESYHSYYVATYLAGNKIFTMNSTADVSETAQQFNVVLMDQQTRTQWKKHLSLWFLDCAKYNIGAIDCVWDTQLSYSVKATAVARKGLQAQRTETVWKGNALKHVDMYNCVFDHLVTPSDIAEHGEYAGSIMHKTQVGLFNLISSLKMDKDMTVYDQPTKEDPNFSVYDIMDASHGAGMDYYTVEIESQGSKGTNMNESTETNWSRAFGLTSLGGEISPDRQYVVAKIYLRVVPSAYQFPQPKNTVEGVEIWEVWLLGGNHVLATKRLNNAHGLLPMVFGQPDADSLKYNSSGPAQIALPYQKTAKQMLDRLMAGADRAIRDRGIFDPRYIDANKINSVIPDAKIPIKTEALPSTKSIKDIYYSIPFVRDTTDLGSDMEKIKAAGQRAAGINNSMVGQFTKGNRTLEEYNDVQANAQGKQFLRALLLEATAISVVKRILKLNILQYQEDAQLYDQDARTNIQVDKSKLFKADLDFKLADGLVPTEHYMSPNIVQQVFGLIGTNPQAFANYDLGGLTAHIIQQSLGVDLQQFKMAASQGQAAPAAPQIPRTPA